MPEGFVLELDLNAPRSGRQRGALSDGSQHITFDATSRAPMPKGSRLTPFSSARSESISSDVFDQEHVVKTCFFLDDTGKTRSGPDGRPLKAFAWMVAPTNNSSAELDHSRESGARLPVARGGESARGWFDLYLFRLQSLQLSRCI